jgi:hypothetical protein
MYKKYTAVITLAMIVTTMIATNILQMNFAHAQGTAENLDFVVTVRNIEHKDVFVELRITGGATQNITIDGLPSYIDAPNVQIVKFTFPRESDTPGIPPLKIGDEYFPCVSYEDSEASCLRSTIDSLTVGQAKSLDVKAIPA